MNYLKTVLLIVLVTWLPMGNSTWWKGSSSDDDEPDGKCLVAKPDPKNKDGKPIMVWVDCDWDGERFVTRATTTTVKPKTTTRPIITRPPGKCLAQSDVYKYRNGEPAWVWVECDWTSGRPKPITKKPSTTTVKPAGGTSTTAGGTSTTTASSRSPVSTSTQKAVPTVVTKNVTVSANSTTTRRPSTTQSMQQGGK